MTAFFDLDHTLLRTSVGELYGRYMFRHGHFPWHEVLRTTWWAMAHRLNMLDVEAFLTRSSAWISGKPETFLSESCRTFVPKVVPKYLYDKGLLRIDFHRERGEKVYLLSAASRYVVEPVVELLGIDGCLASELEVVNGYFTGRVIPPFCYGEGKLWHLKKFCAANQLNLSECSFYGDSFSDAHALAAVGEAFAVNPDARLRREAVARGWTILTF